MPIIYVKFIVSYYTEGRWINYDNILTPIERKKLCPLLLMYVLGESSSLVVRHPSAHFFFGLPLFRCLQT